MTGPDTCTLFVPQDGGYTALVLRGVHWQEEIVGTKGLDSTGMLASKRIVRVYAPLAAPLPEGLAALCCSSYLARGEHEAPGPSAGMLTLMAAARCNFGGTALRHWELLAE